VTVRDPIATELNTIIQQGNPFVYDMLSEIGKALFFPKGILSQTAEAKEKAYRFNATIGMATEKGSAMHLSPVMAMVNGLTPAQALTYAPSFGIPSLRKAWKAAIFRKSPSLSRKAISLPIVSQGLTHGLSVVSDMWVDPGDALILPDKMWGNYNLIFKVRRGAQIIHYPLFDREGRFHLKAFEGCVMSEGEKRGKLVVLLNFPNNPTGYTVTPEEAAGIRGILKNLAERGTNVITVTDDAYFGLFYDERCLQESIFSTLSDVHPRVLCVKLDGATKEDFAWGLRVGFITYSASLAGDPAPLYNALERKTAGAVRASISNASHLSQEIVLSAMNSDAYLASKAEKLHIMKERAEEVRRVLSDPRYDAAWKPYPFNSGYFMCLQLKTVDAEPLRLHLLEKYGVGLISLGKTDLRVAFSCLEKEDVQELFDTVFQAIKDLEQKRRKSHKA
jgi:aspartate/methionine/tyrosine aminotransferase